MATRCNRHGSTETIHDCTFVLTVLTVVLCGAGEVVWKDVLEHGEEVGHALSHTDHCVEFLHALLGSVQRVPAGNPASTGVGL